MLARGFHYGTRRALVIGWNGGHTAVTLPDGTPVSSGEGGGVRIGGGGAYQPQFSHHMLLPVEGDGPADDPAPVLVNMLAPAPPRLVPTRPMLRLPRRRLRRPPRPMLRLPRRRLRRPPPLRRPPRPVPRRTKRLRRQQLPRRLQDKKRSR